MTEIIISAFLIIGTFFMLTGSVGLLRLPDFYTRVHAVTKSATLGLVGLLIATAISLWSVEMGIKVILAILFHFFTTPAGAHMISRAAYHHCKVGFWSNTIADEWRRDI